MKLEDYETYKKDKTKSSKSRLKDLIDTYAEINRKLNNESSIELNVFKNNIRETYQKEVYFTLIDEIEKPVRFNVDEKSKEYFIPIFTDIDEYGEGSRKISKLFLDKLDLKMLTPEDIRKIASEDENFQGVIINPHSQNFSVDLKNI
ncbi:MAG: hypothetical protein Q4P18_08080 [Methanobrevibacter sp.]|uniref:hypothetical protein n=1 Tax=Methanobrevibacter sp. TaxID=66852 RepID=UPI0026DF639F|nr:hypothetical protein [Methanobrevibacter sp.]MDO5849479.1 hypothetical protein [Methanobrevibacter sp.]